MKLRYITLTGLMAACLGLAGNAQAGVFDVERPPAGAKSLSEIIKKVETEWEGYMITEIEFDDDAWEVEAYGPEGEEIELEIDPMTGEIQED